MTPASPDVARVGHRLRLIKETLDQLRSVQSQATPDADALTRAAVERFLQVVVDLALDINGHLVVALGSAAPQTGRSSFVALGELHVLPPELAEQLAPRAGLRNLLVHHYTDVNFAVITEQLPDIIEEFDAYLRAIATWLDHHTGDGGRHRD